jgi:Uma2 family endonuclease
MMTPMPHDEHQELVALLTSVFVEVVQRPGLGKVRPGVNISDRRTDWQENYRVPDIAVFLKEGTAQNFETHWLGGPDLAVEIASPDDRTRDKIPFYASVGVRELLLIERAPWRLELFRHVSCELKLHATAARDHAAAISSEVVPLTFRLIRGQRRPMIDIRHSTDGRSWTA